MNDKTYDQICKAVHKPGVYCEVANAYTAWIKAIRNATILKLEPNDKWIEDSKDPIIQVRRMRAQDLESPVDLPESEHVYEDNLDVIKLPLPIPLPAEEHPTAPQFLFVRPDEYALFKCVTQRKWCILTGNPGISKSWFQWKFILFCYRLDLFDQFSPFEEKLLGGINEDKPSLQGPTTEDQTCTKQALEEELKKGEESLKGLQTEDQTFIEQEQVEQKEFKEDEPLFKKRRTEDQTSTKQDQAEQNVPSEPFIPQLIVRTEAGEDSWLFFVGRDVDVLHVEHSPKQLKRFTDGNSTILWEPASIKTPVYYLGVEAQIVVTASPNVDLFHEFRKRAGMFYMPCPGELQIRLMGQIYRTFATEFKNCPSDAEIHHRVMNFGPFIRTALCWDSTDLNQFNKDRQDEIDGLVTDARTLRAKTQIMEPVNGKRLSHRSVRFVVHRNTAVSFLGYNHSHYQFSCNDVLRLIQVAIAQMGIEVVKAHLIAINQGGIGLSECLPILLERIFELYALEKGIKWKFRPMQLKDSKRIMKWEMFVLEKFNKVERTKTSFQNVVDHVLYYPNDPTFPLVDMYYRDDSGRLVGIQATMSEKHAKGVSTYQRFYDEIETNPVSTPLMLYYMILPCNVEHFDQLNFPLSQFWKDVGSGIATQWKHNISFFALVPPVDFGAVMS